MPNQLHAVLTLSGLMMDWSGEMSFLYGTHAFVHLDIPDPSEFRHRP